MWPRHAPPSSSRETTLEAGRRLRQAQIRLRREAAIAAAAVPVPAPASAVAPDLATSATAAQPYPASVVDAGDAVPPTAAISWGGGGGSGFSVPIASASGIGGGSATAAAAAPSAAPPQYFYYYLIHGHGGYLDGVKIKVDITYDVRFFSHEGETTDDTFKRNINASWGKLFSRMTSGSSLPDEHVVDSSYSHSGEISQHYIFSKSDVPDAGVYMCRHDLSGRENNKRKLLFRFDDRGTPLGSIISKIINVDMLSNINKRNGYYAQKSIPIYWLGCRVMLTVRAPTAASPSASAAAPSPASAVAPPSAHPVSGGGGAAAGGAGGSSG